MNWQTGRHGATDGRMGWAARPTWERGRLARPVNLGARVALPLRRATSRPPGLSPARRPLLYSLRVAGLNSLDQLYQRFVDGIFYAEGRTFANHRPIDVVDLRATAIQHVL